MARLLTGLRAEILIAEGKLDDRARMAAIIPEPKDSVFGDAMVRQVMDMTTALDFGEDHADPNAKMVLVGFVSYPDARNATNDSASLPAYQGVAAYLMRKR